MGKIATAVAGLALIMGQAALAQEQPAAAGAVTQPTTDSVGQPAADQTVGSADAGQDHHYRSGIHRFLPPRDPRAIAAALAALSLLTLGIIFATDNGRSHHPTSP